MALLGLGFLRSPRVSTHSLAPFVVSAFLVSIFQFSLSLRSSSLLVMLPVSALVLVAVAVIGGALKRLRVSASASALVFLNIFFVFGVYTLFIRQVVSEVQRVPKSKLEIYISRNLVISTMIFSILQVTWQVIFLMWHVYCICFNIKTDEWINWTTYPEFHLTLQSQSECMCLSVHFSGQLPQMELHNPYDRGILLNIREFLKGCS